MKQVIRNISVLALFAAITLLALFAAEKVNHGVLAKTGNESQFSVTRARALYEQLVVKDVPRPTGSAANLQTVDNIYRHLKDLGLEVVRQVEFICNQDTLQCSQVVNLIAKSREYSGTDYVLVASHHDTVPASAGDADPGAGMAIALGLAEQDLMAQGVMLLFSDGEEIGLLGAKAFIERHPWADSVSAVVNLEARGTSGPSLMFETGSKNHSVIRALASSMARPVASSFFTGVYQFMPNQTDFTLFKQHDYQGANFAFIGGWDHYHTEADSGENLSLDSVQHQGDNAVSLIRGLLNQDGQPAQANNLAFTDILTFSLVSWPEEWTPLILFVFVAVFSVAIWRQQAMQALDIDVLMHRTLVWLGVLALAAMAGWLLSFFALSESSRGYLFVASAALAVAYVCAQTESSDGLSTALVPWLGLFFLALILLLITPALTAPFLPLLILITCVTALTLLFARWHKLLLVLLLATGTAALISFDLLAGWLELAVGFQYPALFLVLWTLGCMLISACFGAYLRDRGIAKLALGTAMLCCIAAVLVADDNHEHQLNYIKLQAHSGDEYLVAYGDTREVAASSDHVMFQNEQQEYYPWAPGYRAFGMELGSQGQQVADIAVERVQSGVYRIAIPENINADSLMLILPGQQLTQIDVAGQLIATPGNVQPRVLHLYGLTDGTNEITLRYQGDAQGEMYWVQKNWGLSTDQALPVSKRLRFGEGDTTMRVRHVKL
ncbi:M28 family peptidase [Microbulbifer sp. ANSA003]|uniref:M28 family peptidase n=1 Tax=Microbulbifer sp. ANSA003 TaxID=3243360 RepID=UPI0040416BF7